MSSDSTPLLTEMSVSARAVALDYYEAGVVAGIAIGRQQVEDEWFGLIKVSAAVARQIAQRGSYADLCDRRGEDDRAERQRTLLGERGIA